MKIQKYKKKGNKGLFDEQETIQKLIQIGNPLERILNIVDFEMFRDVLEKFIFSFDKKNNAGAKPYDVVMMFKIMILQRYYGLGDSQIEYQIHDRLSFKKFLGLESGDKIPDEKTVWAFREKITESGLIEQIFEQFNQFLSSNGLIMNQGKMVDASFTVAPRQRNTHEENKLIKEGRGDELWNDKPNKKKHKDIDARWTKKNNETFFGYKNHTKVDTKSKFIDNYVVTDASVHDSQPLGELLKKSDKGQPFHADSAYTGETQEKTIKDFELENLVHEKAYRNKPLSEEQKKKNHEKSKIRARVEHVYGFMEQSMKGLKIRSVGIVRATGIIGLMNLTYNLFRYEQVVRLKIV